jgi:hypothetical protein
VLTPEFLAKREEALKKLHAQPCPGAGVDLDREREMTLCYSWANDDTVPRLLALASTSLRTRSTQLVMLGHSTYNFIQSF